MALSLTASGEMNGGPATGVGEAEMEFIEREVGEKQQQYGDSIRVVCSVMVQPAATRRNPAPKPVRRILVLTRHQLFTIKKRSGLRRAPAVVNSAHLLQITHIRSQQPRTLELRFLRRDSGGLFSRGAADTIPFFSSPAHPDQSSAALNNATFTSSPAASSVSQDDMAAAPAIDEKTASLKILSTGAPHIVRFLLEGLDEISQGFPAHMRPVVEVAAENWKAPALRPAEEYLGAGVAETYRAYCSYFRVPQSAELVRFVEETVSMGRPWLDLSLCPGLAPGEASPELSPALLPVCAALRCNAHFRGLCVESPPAALRRDLVLHLGNVLACNATLTAVRLRGLSAPSAQWETLGQQLLGNGGHRLQRLDLSNNKLDARCFFSLMQAVAAFPHALRSLKLSSCSLNPKCLAVLVNTFERRYDLFLSLEELDLSFNSSLFDEEGAAAFERLLTAPREFNGLESLSLAKTSGAFSFASLARPLVHLRWLTALDLSRNGDRIDFPAAQAVAAFLEGSRCLRRFSLAHTRPKPQALEGMLRALLLNAELSQLEVDLSDAGIDHKAVLLLSPLFHNGIYRTRSLDLSRNKLGEAGLITLFSALSSSSATNPQPSSPPPSLSALLIDDCIHASPKSPAALADALHALLVGNPNIRSLSLSGGYSRVAPFFLRKTLSSELLCLRELDLSRNRLGDVGASLVAAALCQNRTLLYLNLDANGIGLNGYTSLEQCLAFPDAENTSLTNSHLLIFKWPWEDYLRASSSLSAPLLDRLRSSLERIQSAIRLPPVDDLTQLDPFFLASRHRIPALASLLAQLDIPQAPSEPEPLPHLPPHLLDVQAKTPSLRWQDLNPSSLPFLRDASTSTPASSEDQPPADHAESAPNIDRPDSPPNPDSPPPSDYQSD
ncbi:MAG: hypothetical protein Q8P67_09550 [archaeon]|nr:hypothetical protein [archaeon]